MDTTTSPARITLPFANGGAKNTIPIVSQVSITPGAASYTDGFPPLTRTPIAAGGIPPFGVDMNGILYSITAIQQWQSAGCLFKYDATFATAIGGYPKGARLINAASTAVWVNLVDNNTTNPDTGGANWQLGESYIPSGTGAQTRSIQTRLTDMVFVGDYDTLAHAKTAAGNKPVYDPLGIAYKDVFNNLTNVYQESGETTWFSASVQRSADNAGAHSGSGRSVHTIESRPIGSGASGEASADIGMTLSVIKQNFLTTTTQGEIDGLRIVVRQGGGSTSDCGAILTNTGIVNNSGFAASMENQTTQMTGLGATTRQIQTQVGVIDGPNSNYFGFFAQIRAGTGTTAFSASDMSGTSWTDFLRYDRNATGGTVFRVDGFGRIVLTDQNNGAATPNKTLRSLAGSFSILNHAQSAELLNLADSGLLSVGGSISTTTYKVSGTQVLQEPITGYGTPTGASRLANFPGASATLAQCSAQIAQMIIDAKTHGFFGA